MNPQTCLVVRRPAPGRCCPPARTRFPRSVPPRHGPRPADPGSWAPRKTRRVEHLRCWPLYVAGHAPLHAEMKISAAKSCRECSRQKVSKISQCFPIAPLTYETWDVQVVEEGAILSGLEGPSSHPSAPSSARPLEHDGPGQSLLSWLLPWRHEYLNIPKDLFSCPLHKRSGVTSR